MIKRLFVLFFSVTCLFLYCSCAHSNKDDPMSSTTYNGITTSVTTGIEGSSAYVGMTYNEFVEKYVDISYEQYWQYVFFVNSSGNNVVVKFSGDGKKIEKLASYTAVLPKAEDFSSLQKDMTIFDVVEKVGLPFRSATFGLQTLDFKSSNDEIFRINLKNNIEDNSIRVIEVCQIDDNNGEIIKTIVS